MPDSEDHDATIWPGIRPWVALVLAGMLPVVGLAAYAHRLASAAMERDIEAANLSAARITRELVEREFAHWVSTLDGFSRLPGLVDAVRNRDEEAVRDRLEILVESKPRVVRAFATDPDGLLWSDYPRAPESLGRSFDFRDWYQGLSRSWEPYVSRVYRRTAEPQPLLVAIAAPVRDRPDETVIGAVVYQLRLEGITRTLQRVDVGSSGFVFLVDHAGLVAAHPRLDLQVREYDDYAGSPAVAAALDGGEEVRYTDPLSGEGMLAAAVVADVQGHRWVVVAQQPVEAALRPVRVLGWQIAGAGVLLAFVVGGLGLGLTRSHGRVRAMNLRLGEANEALERENADRQRAEQALQRSHDELEARVEERTRELRQREEQLRHAQKMEAVGRLAGGVAHDFNNLLSVIISYCELALADLPAEAPYRREIEEVRAAGERAATLTRQLLAFSRKQVLKPEVIDLNEVVGRMDRMLQRVIGEDIDLVTRLKPEVDSVRFDPGQIEQIIVNLAVNARDAMPHGGKLTVETANVVLEDDYARSHADAQAGAHVMLAVTDTGVGMDEETRAKVFEPFFTTKELGQGTGLGLSTVYGIVKQSGGNIWVYSEPGEGTTFKVYLPAVEAEPASEKPRRKEPAVPTGTETVLVVEDEPSVRALVVDVLESHGYTVLEAADGDQALEASEAHDGTIHLLLTDVVLPGIAGPRIAEVLAGRRPGIEVLYMSGYTDDAIVHRGVLAEGTAFLEKPLRPATLLEKVREVLSAEDEP